MHTVGHGDRDTRGGRGGAPLALRRDDASARPSVPAPPAPILHPAAAKWRQPCPCASDTLHPGYSAAAALARRRRWQRPGRREHLVHAFHAETAPVNANYARPLSVPVDRSEFNPRLRLFSGVLPAVPEQTLVNPAKQARVSPRL